MLLISYHTNKIIDPLRCQAIKRLIGLFADLVVQCCCSSHEVSRFAYIPAVLYFCDLKRCRFLFLKIQPPIPVKGQKMKNLYFISILICIDPKQECEKSEMQTWKPRESWNRAIHFRNPRVAKKSKERKMIYGRNVNYRVHKKSTKNIS